MTPFDRSRPLPFPGRAPRGDGGLDWSIRKTLDGEGALRKAPTGIPGLDSLTKGGLAHGRTTAVAGGPGTGKTLLALRTLVHGARHLDEPGLFVSFEETTERILANAEGFGWDLPALEDRLELFGYRPPVDLAISGGFDLGGLLAGLEARVEALGARRIALDAVDVLLCLADDPAAVRREVRRLHEWLESQGLTALVTFKDDAGGGLEFVRYLVDSTLLLDLRLVDGVSHRSIQVQKYRGSGHDENRTPLLIGPRGPEVAWLDPDEGPGAPATSERVSSGVERLDTMLGGGYFRGSGILITGAPGTAKTTLGGAFVRAACRRGEPALLVSFDSRPQDVRRNLASVGIDLEPFVASGALHLRSAHAFTGNAESHLMHIREEVRRLGARSLVIDPLSALSRSGLDPAAVGRLVGWAHQEGLTMLCTSLLEDRATPEAEATDLDISTLADTWIHLTYHVAAGERNRGLTVVKSRGTSHSNQVRELRLGPAGVTVADVYAVGGEVLMGGLRLERERQVRLAEEAERAEAERRRLELDLEMAELEARRAALTRGLEAKKAARAALDAALEGRAREREDARHDLLRLRQADGPG